MSSIYVVMGMSGEYSDRNEWPVYYFTEEHLAQSFIRDTEYKYKEFLAAINSVRIPPDRNRTHEENKAVWDRFADYKAVVKKKCMAEMGYAFEYYDPYNWDDTSWYVMEVKPSV